jgi:trimeric autotransporter adhesin
MTFPVSPTNNSITNVSGITYVYASATNSWTRVTTTSVHTGAIPNTVALRDATGSLTAVNFHGFATSAAYADLAEKYLADTDYPAGTVVVFGGEQEVTTTEIDHDSRVAGVISTNPAYLMNSESTGVPVALTGRVPCHVQGPVDKGDLLVTSNIPGVAQRLVADKFQPGCVIGKSLECIMHDEIKLIEVVVGRY